VPEWIRGTEDHLVDIVTLTHLLTTIFRPEHSHAHIDIDRPNKHQHFDVSVDTTAPRRRQYEDEVDVIERQYRSRVQPTTYREEVRVNTTVDPPRFQPTKREEYNLTEETVDPARFQVSKPAKMGYYDEDGMLFPLRCLHLPILKGHRSLSQHSPWSSQGEGPCEA